MLSLAPLTAERAGYYERQVARGFDDYYSGRGEAPGQWIGRGAEELGLEGRVSGEQFRAMIAGIDPSDPGLARVLRAPGARMKVVAWDLTFSAPKSVSVEAVVQDEATRAQIAAAHEAAAAAALAYIEERAVKVRRGHGGAEVLPGEGLIAAAYRHRMSRALDAQLHTHVVAAAVVKGPDGAVHVA